jgi:hypothetical protein
MRLPLAIYLPFTIALLFTKTASSQCTVFYNGGSTLNKIGSFSEWIIQLNSFEESPVYLTQDITTASGERILHEQSCGFGLVRGKNNQVPAGCNSIPQFTSGDAQGFYAANGILPYNNYTVCVEVHEQGTGKLLGRACKDFNLILTPPQLVSPFNEEHVLPGQPVFSWLRPQNSQGESKGIDYTIIISEVQAGQSGTEAINSNPNLIQQSNLRSESYLYPTSAKELVPGQLYAWQVTAFSGKQLIGKTEVWTFTPDSFAKKAKVLKQPSGSFTDLKRQLDAGFIPITNGVRFKVTNSDNIEPTQLTFYDESHHNITPPQLQFKGVYSASRYEIDLFPFKQFKNDHIYYLEYQSRRGEILKMGFKYSRKKKIST